jgi:magnesium-transporting ATPase (P-type)
LINRVSARRICFFLQAFGSKIGLFTDWNSYVSLKDPEEVRPGAAPRRRTQGTSQMPWGISSIRPHLQSVDNVPLLISLFTDCEPHSVREMVRIYQANGESVMVMGSSLKVDNTHAFMQADISASLDPMPSKECAFKTFKQNARPQQGRAGMFDASAANRQQPRAYQQILQQYQNAAADAESSDNAFTYSEAREFAASSALTSMPCALLLSATTDLHHFMALICEGRRLLHCMTQCLCFCAASYLTLALVLLVNFVANAPTILTGYQLLWLIWVIVPLLSLSLLHSPRELDLMRQLPQKNTVKEEGLLTIGLVGMEEGEADSKPASQLDHDAMHADHNHVDFDEDDMDEDGMRLHRARSMSHAPPRRPRRKAIAPPILPDASRYVVYFLTRFAPSALIYLVLYLWLLHESAEKASFGDIRSNFYWSTSYPRALFNNRAFQSLQLTVQNYALVAFVAALAVHSAGFVYRYDSVRQTSPLKNRAWIICALVCVLLQVCFCIVSVFSVSAPRVELVSFRWYIFLAWPFLIVALDEVCKRHDRIRRDFLHKKARQHFDTVLGMHSPK